MSLLDDEDIFDPDPTEPLQASPIAAFGEEPRTKEKRDKRKGSALSLGRPKPKELQTEKTPKKGKHARTKSGSRTPPDSPRAGWSSEGRRVNRSANQPSPNVKSHRKRYSQLGLDEHLADSPEEDVEATNYFANQAASDPTADDPISSETQEPFFSIEKESPPPPAVTTSPGHRATVHFPVQFGEASAPSSSVQFSLFDTQPISSTLFAGEQPPQSPTDPLLPLRNLQSALPPQSVPWPATEPSPPRPESPRQVPDSEWKVSHELQLKCRKQFLDLKPTNGRLQGDQARSFFIQSRLPNSELSTIWRLADMDKDNALSEEEFCVAMKLVLLRRKGYSLPSVLPEELRGSESLRQPTTAQPPPFAHTQSSAEPLPSTKQPHHPQLADIMQQSSPELVHGRAGSPVLVDQVPEKEEDKTALIAADEPQEEPPVATIVSLGSEEKGPKEEEEGEDEAARLVQKHAVVGRKPVRPPPPKPSPSVRRAKSLKQFPATPAMDRDAQRGSPPSQEPFSPPAANDDTVPIIALQKPSPKANPRKASRPSDMEKAGYSALKGANGEKVKGLEKGTVSELNPMRERGHSRSTSLDLNKMMEAAGSSVYTDLPAAEPPKPPPKPAATQEEGEVQPLVRGRSASTGSITSTGSAFATDKDSPSAMDTSTRALLLSGMQVHSRPQPSRKAPILPPVPKPRRPPPPVPKPEHEVQDMPQPEPSLLRNKGELQTTIRSLKDTNATLQAINKELEEKLFSLMEERVQLARELELAKQMQCST